MRFVVLFILLAFPVLDLIVTMRFARWTGIPTFVWLITSATVGLLLLRHERGGFRARTLGALRGDQPLMRGLVDSGRKVLAAMLFIMPGIISDALAVALLLLPINLGRRLAAQTANGFGDTLDGDYRGVD
ncbi:MAG TPA: FxsA family protein [Casimicrobiaceae bacterium]|nr:FxsA family protein [Casimicrobiaceae bacterium]